MTMSHTHTAEFVFSVASCLAVSFAVSLWSLPKKLLGPDDIGLLFLHTYE